MADQPTEDTPPVMREQDMAFYYWFHQYGDDESFKQQRLAFMAGWNGGKSSTSQTRAT